MRQRNGRRKFHDLRLLTFQDWILPSHTHCYKLSDIMSSKQPLPVFGYTKMETGPPLSAISSQFAWADDSLLPDLVQEQSNRLLRRLERPRTAEHRTANLKNNQMRGSKVPRPTTAFSMRRRVEYISAFGVNGKRMDSNAHAIDNTSEICDEDEKVNQQREHDSPESERSSSPDFIAGLYKEYERKIASDACDDEVFSCLSGNATPKSTPTKLLRRPSIQSTAKKKNSLEMPKANSEENLPSDKKIHCVIKIPSEEFDSSSHQTVEQKCSVESDSGQKSEMWLDLSQLCLSSGDEANDADIVLTRSSSIVGDSSDLKFLDLISQDSGETGDKETKKSKAKRPSSSKNHPHKHRPKSKRKKRRTSTSNAEESTKEITKSLPTNNQKLRSDKLREEIETQMSILDSNILPTTKAPTRTLLGNQRKAKDLTPQFRPSFANVSVTSAQVLQAKPRLPLKKVPIQILSDPFMVGQKICHENAIGSEGNEKIHKVPGSNGSPAEGTPMLKMSHDSQIYHLQSSAKAKGMIPASRLQRRFLHPGVTTNMSSRLPLQN